MYLTHDQATNALRLTLDLTPPTALERTITLRGVIDVTAKGRLAGIELRDPGSGLPAALRRWAADPSGELIRLDDDSAYIELGVGDDDDDVRSADIELLAEFAAGNELLAIAIPRRGAGYEISYPSGNR